MNPLVAAGHAATLNGGDVGLARARAVPREAGNGSSEPLLKPPRDAATQPEGIRALQSGNDVKLVTN